MVKKYPKLRFVISKGKELDTYLTFLEQSKYMDNERDMDWAFYKHHPILKSVKNKDINILKKKTTVKKYINDYYGKKIRQIKSGNLNTKNEWSKVEEVFFLLTDEIFKDFPWPNGKYIAYPTIWGMYPKFLDTKTFQFPYEHRKKKFINVVIAHEMLHFIFYDYLYRNFPKFKKHKYDFDVWNISEVFNVIIQNSNSWKKFFDEGLPPYPEHKKLVKELKIVWKKTDGDVKKFLTKVLPKG